MILNSSNPGDLDDGKEDRRRFFSRKIKVKEEKRVLKFMKEKWIN